VTNADYSRRAFLAVAGGALAGVALGACGGDNSSSSSGSTTATSSGGAGASTASSGAASSVDQSKLADKLTIGIASLASQSPDPFQYRASGAMYQIWYTSADVLARRELDGSLVPSLATEWSVADDQLTWTVTLRDGVTMHDGSKFTANDVKTAIDRVLDPNSAAVKAGGWGPYIAAVAGAEVVDDRHIKITTKQPYPFLVEETPPPIPTAYYQKVGDAGFVKAPMASGPMKYVSQNLNQSMTFERFDEFWDATRKPNYRQLVLQLITEEATRVAGLQTGELDVVYGLSQAALTQLKGNNQVRIIQVPQSAEALAAFLDLYYPDEKSPVLDLRVRKALYMALDRKAIASSLYGPDAVEPYNVGQVAMLGNDTSLKPYPYDPEGAKKLLAEAGQSNMAITIQVFNASGIIPEVQKLASVIASYWKQIGVNADVKVTESGAYLAAYGKHELRGVSIFGQGGTNYEPYSYNTLYSSKGIYSSLRDPVADDIFARAATTMDQSKREAVGKELSDYFYNQVPTMPVVLIPTYYAVGPKVADFKTKKGQPVAGPYWYLTAKV
jgi:peptide/nickel transport system substrate-binding protein